MAEIRNEYGGCSIERCINFERREGYMENMRVEVKTDAMLSPEKTKEMTCILQRANELSFEKFIIHGFHLLSF